MPIDPVVLIAEQLRSVEDALSKATQAYSRSGRRYDGEAVNLLLAKLKRSLSELSSTVPTSCLGAAELIDIAARRLPSSHSRFAIQLHDIAKRLSIGQRDHEDLIWLRALQAALLDGLCGHNGQKVAPLIGLATIGVARPVVIFRSAQTAPGSAPWKSILVAQPV